MSEADDNWKGIDRQCRFALWACVVGLLLAYALVLPLKFAGLMPERLSWLALLIAPGAVFSILGSQFAGVLILRQRWGWLFLPTAVLGSAAMMAVIWWERGW